MQGDPSHRSSSVLTTTFMLNGLLAVALSLCDAGLLALILHAPRSERYAETETIGIALILGLVLVPGFVLFSAFLSSLSWLWHPATDEPRPIWVDALLGIAGGLVLGGSYIAQDVMGIRPDTVAELTGRNVMAVATTSVVLGGIMGFASGAITRSINAWLQRYDATASRIVSVINAVILVTMTAPGLALMFTFAHFTGRSGALDVVASPFVFAMALAIVGALGAGHLLVLSGLVIAHHVVLGGKGSLILDCVMSMGGAALTLVLGPSLLESGMDNFADTLSFAVPVVTTLFLAAILSIILGLGWAAPSQATPAAPPVG